ncbi:MAG: hypothetical protein ACTHKG_19065 [Nocardioides sp.]
MVVDKDAVTAALREQGEHDRAVQAESALPRTVDTELDALTLHQLGLSVSEVEATAATDDTEDAEPVG